MKRMWNSIRMKVSGYKQYILLSAVLLAFAYIGYEYYFKYSYILRNPNILKEVILSYGNFSVLIFILMQVLQVVVFFIPGEFIQIAGGYIFGAFLGGIISLMGITLGGIIVYLIANSYGRPFVEKLLLKKKVKFFRKILKIGSKKNVIFIFFLIPGIPKDALIYICGVSDVSFKDFFIYSTLGRIPGIFISSYFGQKIDAWDVTSLITIGITMSIISIVGIFKGNTIIKNVIKKKKSY
ncbi:TVP38/TMEM64 family protein [Clostridium sp. CM028]|uniref:TVP38/TMEM64 family protein n=1 Tax=unclassified Clostridium TaxID=2614128 RepID=UPI001C0AED1E|nr:MULTISPECIES: TVP38/TMEM64 family protein [unclassified Clostridium]MBU3091275.1 TVP38/TMEM64 family protein [Clostridium sp. CF011]MBW9147028.1 TVP38/TMEM64 family protein [Clostridium sp. CM027]MBW9150133.1 TVP38/TMEM64 family protein [Clostridium sp. CM028]UVE39674.1 TVP38/TMEM64 family protein [Clostridium sp. CM027]WAG68583.1 TVP38/TMEM64 family protein [Clostridium sp. CF011]